MDLSPIGFATHRRYLEYPGTPRWLTGVRGTPGLAAAVDGP
ncbi:hypothetical protein I546_6668 [Mycobacterium kansasii 732]|uniref:Uncharacterized protein n=1 Tax=Mycobacterium pseudokansasii TaxID=2341080 RepID=A0A498QTT1_9MYCO|nr:hypothetical protein [Mycobacterium pseudokansasii]ETZ99682.1 hypothetical protein I546_6668 [Mycobacterium kansasii 732]VAZ96462.1 hypothetical protein LAUMK35_03347 [Mycobacterium pseudokansasii]VAZ97836.1 hypothetical protein LAUMK21_03346 [Mycobacterium pseudokansasii]VBA51829.1 hypothetical protein LAUMK142_03273 [Mycobacterium pseudokansasii]